MQIFGSYKPMIQGFNPQETSDVIDMKQFVIVPWHKFENWYSLRMSYYLNFKHKRIESIEIMSDYIEHYWFQKQKLLAHFPQ